MDPAGCLLQNSASRVTDKAEQGGSKQPDCRRHWNHAVLQVVNCAGATHVNVDTGDTCQALIKHDLVPEVVTAGIRGVKRIGKYFGVGFVKQANAIVRR